jgi:hypothetical protein
MAFLQQVCMRTRICSGAENFVNDLHRKWLIRSKPREVFPLRFGDGLLYRLRLTNDH